MLQDGEGVNHEDGEQTAFQEKVRRAYKKKLIEEVEALKDEEEKSYNNFSDPKLIKRQRLYLTAMGAGAIATLLGFVRQFDNSVLYEAIFITGNATPFILTLMMFYVYKVWFAERFATSDTSFVELDKRTELNDAAKVRAQTQAQVKALMEEVSRLKTNVAGVIMGPPVNPPDQEKVRDTSYDFIENIQEIISNLDGQIRYAEEKASRLLENGRSFIKWGIWFYIGTIFVWQIYLFGVDFKLNAGMIVGMVSCTILFVTVEFLGAWFLKQYRHYGDSAFAYMKVRSMYGRHLLSYCAVFEFGQADELAKNDMLRMLEKADEWPELKDLNKNDFNHMLQVVDSVGLLFEKSKGMFNNGKRSKTQL